MQRWDPGCVGVDLACILNYSAVKDLLFHLLRVFHAKTQNCQFYPGRKKRTAASPGAHLPPKQLTANDE
jgi:hypothetical protein